MSVRFYDEAVANRIKSWIKDPDLLVLKPDETARLFQTRADIKNDKKLTLPLIALSREPEIEILNTQRKPMSYDGLKLRLYDNKTGKEVRLNSTFKLRAIPIRIAYQIDIYCKNLVECDEYAREFTFKLINKPTVEIEIPYNNVKLTHESTIHMENTIRDNSDIPERHFETQFTRFTINIIIDDAYYFGVEKKDNLLISAIDVAVDTINKEDGTLLEEEIIDVLS